MNPFAEGPFASSAFHLLTIIDFLCLAAGAYLLLMLHDLQRRFGYLLIAIAFAVLALRIVSQQLALGQPLLQYTGETLSLSISGIVLAWGTLSLVERSQDRLGNRAVQRALLIGAATVALLGTVIVWALPFSEVLRELVTRASADGGFVTFMNGLRVAVAAMLVACTWITWERGVLGQDLSRMFGAAYLLWGSAIMVGLLPLWVPESGYWMKNVVWVLGSLFIGNALALHGYRGEKRALERQKRLRLVDRVATSAINEPRLLPMIKAVSAEVSSLLETRLVATYLVDRETPDQLRLCHELADEELDLPETVSLHSGDSIGRSLQEGRPVEMQFPQNGAGVIHGAAIPLMGLKERGGVLFVALPSGEEFTPSDLTALANAGMHLGVIVQNMVLLEEMRQARDRWRQTFDNITELVTVHDADGRIILANLGFLVFAGVSEDQAMGSELGELLEHCDEQMEALRSCIASGASPGASTHRTRGRIHQVLVTPLRDDENAVVGCVRVARDVTSRWRAEERLAQSERRYRELAEDANDIIYTQDLEGNFLYVNPAAVRTFGYSQEDFKHLQFWDLVAPQSMTAARAYFAGLCADKQHDGQIELRMVCEDERVIVVQLRANLLRRAGQTEAIHGIARDVTAETQLTAQLIQADRLASVGTLIAGIAHELNNPITTIGGYADLLSEELAGTSASDSILKIAEEAERCRTVAQSLLNFARQTDDSPTHFDLNDLIRGVFDLRAYDLREAKITLETELADDLDQVVGEYSQIQQVVYNLIDNAYYALQQQNGGTLRVSTWNEDDRVALRVEDTGPGIPPDMLEHVFEPFMTTKPRGEGTGLGLSICRRILERHAGVLRASNHDAGGAIFTVELPARDSVAMPAGPPDVQEAPNAETEPVEAISARVLFIDDEPSLRALVTEYLERRGHEVRVAATGEEGLEMALSDNFDAIICDMRMPGMSGDEVCSRLLEARPCQADRIMIATGDILSPQVQDFFERTGLAHIHKPFKLADLESDITRLATGRGSLKS